MRDNPPPERTAAEVYFTCGRACAAAAAHRHYVNGITLSVGGAPGLALPHLGGRVCGHRGDLVLATPTYRARIDLLELRRRSQ